MKRVFVYTREEIRDTFPVTFYVPFKYMFPQISNLLSRALGFCHPPKLAQHPHTLLLVIPRALP